ncbi:MAG: EAL domain-containing protein [Pseudomonadales bacterium]|nr:EAL domain-containing protein [Pseudomonadales bacterium]
MNISAFFAWTDEHRRAIQWVAAPVCAAMMICVYFIVMATGGIKYVFSHSMYLPIVFAAIVFGVRGGLLTGIFGGLILGPYVPIDTLTGEPQQTINWLYRMGFFSLIGLTVGLASDGIRSYISRLRWSSRHDSATQLPNRSALEEAITRLRRRDGKNTQLRHLLMISLTNVREIESNFGSEVLDSLILQMASRVQIKSPAGVPVYRVHEHQVCLLLRQYEKFDIHQFCNTLRKYYQEPFIFNGLQMHGDIHIGVVEIDEFSRSPAFYIRRANQAVNEARESDVPVFTVSAHDTDETISENLELLGYLKEALDAQQLLMHYQPKVNLRSGAIEHVEALMRWQHPSMGNIPPALFIPRAERSTLIDRLTEFALDQSLRQVVAWRKKGMHLKVAVNISARNLSQPSFVYQVMRLLDKHQLDGSHLELELTENSLMHNVQKAIDILGKLARQGIALSIDDFGTGYSSLQYLQKLPVSVIKIDQSFVRNLARDAGAIHIVETAVNLAHRMDMTVVAEGVEDRSSLQMLRDIGCDMAQGFYIARPRCAAEFTQWHSACKGQLTELEQ